MDRAACGKEAVEMIRSALDSEGSAHERLEKAASIAETALSGKTTKVVKKDLGSWWANYAASRPDSEHETTTAD